MGSWARAVPGQVLAEPWVSPWREILQASFMVCWEPGGSSPAPAGLWDELNGLRGIKGTAGGSGAGL